MKIIKKPSNSVILNLIENQSKYKKYLGFTLVELIVVIVILAILATIAFLSFNSYSSSSRDSVRLADVANLNKGIELYNVKSGYYPNPDGVISSGTVNGVSVVYKGIVGDIISELANINKTPIDPLSSSNYVYGISYDKKYFQIGVVLESSNTTGYDNKVLSLIDRFLFKTGMTDIDNTYSASGAGNYISRIKGNYTGMIKFSSGTTNKSYYIANIPSLLYNNNGTVDLLSTGTYFVVNNNTNLPYSVSPNVTTNNKTADTIVKDVTNKTTATLTGVDITSIVTSTGTSTQKTTLINNLFTGTTLDSFGGDIGSVTASVSNGGIVTTTSGGGGGGAGATCGTSNGLTVASTPSTNLCSDGSTPTISYSTGIGQYNWSCGSNSCKAYDNYTVLLLHFDNNVTDSFGGKVVTNNNMTYSSSTSKFGSSGYFNGSNAYLTIPDSTDWSMPGDFTIDYWFRMESWPSVHSMMFTYENGSACQLYYRNGGSTIYFNNCGGMSIAKASVISLNTWYHIAVVKNGTTSTMYLNGVSIDYSPSSTTLTSSILDIGRRTDGFYFNGYIDEFRISKGVARRTSNFTPPTSPY